ERRDREPAGNRHGRGAAGPGRPQQQVADEPGPTPHEVVDGHLHREGALHAAGLVVDEGQQPLRLQVVAVGVGRGGVVGHDYFVSQTGLAANPLCDVDAPYDGGLMSAAPTPAYRIVYPPELPVSQAHDELARAISEHQVIVVAGATGSGKTTQLPKICLELGRERIGHTQPRRIAARSIAERIASELGVDLGTVVGYQVRFDDRTRTDTAIKLMTDGVLLAELSRDRDLAAYDTIIIDEAHERSLTIDFLIGYLTRLLPRRPDLKVIVTSATIDPESFARHFAAATGAEVPVIEVSGRTYPVDIRYRPLVADAGGDDADGDSDDEGAAASDRDIAQGIVDALAELEREGPGDVLVFLSGESEIRDAADVVRGRFPADEVVPLYGRLSSAEQHRVFDTRRAPGIRRRIV